MLNRNIKVKECDARKGDQGFVAGFKNVFLYAFDLRFFLPN